MSFNEDDCGNFPRVIQFASLFRIIDVLPATERAGILQELSLRTACRIPRKETGNHF